MNALHQFYLEYQISIMKPEMSYIMANQKQYMKQYDVDKLQPQEPIFNTTTGIIGNSKTYGLAHNVPSISPLKSYNKPSTNNWTMLERF